MLHPIQIDTMHFRFKPRRNPGSQSQHRSVNRTAVLKITKPGGSILDADYPTKGVNIPRRSTSLSAGPGGIGRAGEMRPTGGTSENAGTGRPLWGSPWAGGARPAGFGLVRCRLAAADRTSGPEGEPIPICRQTEADLEAAPWGLLAWEEAFADDGPASPFWADAPMAEGHYPHRGPNPGAGKKEIGRRGLGRNRHRASRLP